MLDIEAIKARAAAVEEGTPCREQAIEDMMASAEDVPALLAALEDGAGGMLPIGTKLRGAHHPDDVGTLGHIRGHVDGRYVIRWWRKHKNRWHYEVIIPHAIECGLWAVEL